MSRSVIPQIIAVVLCLAASWISYKLLAKHVTGSSGTAWFDAGCVEGDDGSGGGCATVLSSPHSYWPPKTGPQPDNKPHVPVAFLGLIYFTSLAVWLISIGRPSRGRKWVHWFPLLWIGAGLAFSARFMWVMYNVIGEWCPWCLTTHVMNLVIAVCVFLLWPRRTPQEPSSSETKICFPSTRHILGTIGVIVIVMYGNYGQVGLLKVHHSNRTLEQCLAAVARIKSDTGRLVKNWQLGEKFDITIRTDDPARLLTPTPQTALPVVVFSDFKCPSCKRFEQFLSEKITPLFDGRIRVVFKHYPLDQACNKMTSRTLHPSACVAARIAEAARILGGNEAFWKAHDLLFELQSPATKNAPYDVASIAQQVGVDANQLRTSMGAEMITQRLNEDAALAKACKVTGTPAIFVNGKRVDTLAATEVGFWNALAESYWHEIKLPRPASTRPQS
jgi:protein-disulfide isomerase/uncharacterized membrane protein